MDLEVVSAPRRGDGAVTVIDPTGRHLKVPSWMLHAEAALASLTDRGVPSVASLLVVWLLLRGVLPGPEGSSASETDTLAPPRSQRGQGGVGETAEAHARRGGGARRRVRGMGAGGTEGVDRTHGRRDRGRARGGAQEAP
jgi:hypothetical protein